jgi:hypothetical protein
MVLKSIVEDLTAVAAIRIVHLVNLINLFFIFVLIPLSAEMPFFLFASVLVKVSSKLVFNKQAFHPQCQESCKVLSFLCYVCSVNINDCLLGTSLEMKATRIVFC